MNRTRHRQRAGSSIGPFERTRRCWLGIAEASFCSNHRSLAHGQHTRPPAAQAPAHTRVPLPSGPAASLYELYLPIRQPTTIRGTFAFVSFRRCSARLHTAGSVRNEDQHARAPVAHVCDVAHAHAHISPLRGSSASFSVVRGVRCRDPIANLEGCQA